MKNLPITYLRKQAIWTKLGVYWKKLLEGVAILFHFSGITPAISCEICEKTLESALMLCKKEKKIQVVC